ncbi:hypothetical protein HPB47_009397 [Ixodes persulcatus]|uniref:Uncharacterized protein n=1 Tax=Ixodes persulcatus TaxID=34615 RepID=A0AC60P277_IXOPE|nr:hypothetical protein HPB47_009397 [Ixodes persulcatus]
MGSDHYLIWIEIHTTGRARRTKQTQAIDWDAFRQAVKEFEDDLPVVRRLSRAANTATRLHKIYAEDPVPDKHLSNLWESREDLHQAYLRNGKLHSDLIRVRGKTAKHYARRLSRSRWFEHCASFDERTGLKKLWYTHRELWGKTTTPNIARNIQLAANLTAEQLEEEAENYFFPQLGLNTSGNVHAPKEAGNSGPDAPFSMRELFLALESVNERSTPGKDGITWRMLRNLDKPEKKKLLAQLNHVWETGVIPGEWKHSVFYLIPKPGKKADRIQNLRPISLTTVDTM